MIAAHIIARTAARDPGNAPERQRVTKPGTTSDNAMSKATIDTHWSITVPIPNRRSPA